MYLSGAWYLAYKSYPLLREFGDVIAFWHLVFFLFLSRICSDSGSLGTNSLLFFFFVPVEVSRYATEI